MATWILTFAILYVGSWALAANWIIKRVHAELQKPDPDVPDRVIFFARQSSSSQMVLLLVATAFFMWPTWGAIWMYNRTCDWGGYVLGYCRRLYRRWRHGLGPDEWRIEFDNGGGAMIGTKTDDETIVMVREGADIDISEAVERQKTSDNEGAKEEVPAK